MCSFVCVRFVQRVHRDRILGVRGDPRSIPFGPTGLDASQGFRIVVVAFRRLAWSSSTPSTAIVRSLARRRGVVVLTPVLPPYERPVVTQRPILPFHFLLCVFFCFTCLFSFCARIYNWFSDVPVVGAGVHYARKCANLHLYTFFVLSQIVNIKFNLRSSSISVIVIICKVSHSICTPEREVLL